MNYKAILGEGITGGVKLREVCEFKLIWSSIDFWISGGFLMLDEAEYDRWIRSSKQALNSARGDFERGEYNWVCFKAHQAAEFSVKALLHGLGLPAYGHSISALLSKFSDELRVEERLTRIAKTLDKYYVPTRYPNAWAEGTPEDYYTVEDASQAIKYAEKILGWAEDSWKSLRKGGV